MKDFQAFLSLVMSLLTHFPFFQITSDYLISCFSWSSSGETAANLEVLHLLDQALSSILSRCPKHCNLLSCKNSILLFNFSRVPSSFVEILSSKPKLHIHLIILVSFLSSLMTSSFLFGQVSFPFSTAIHTYPEYNLLYAPKSMPLLATKGAKYLNLHHPLSNAPPSSSCCAIKITTFFHNFKGLAIYFYA